MARFALNSLVRSSTRSLVRLGGASLMLSAVACNGEAEGDPPAEDSGDFLSYVNPNSGYGGLDSAGEADGGDGDAAPTADGAERVISEADIIQVDGDRLYALSRFSGLSIVNIKDPTNLRLVGNYRTSADPFEMYLEGGVAYVMYNGWYDYSYDEESNAWSWNTTSRMVALDVNDPANIQLVGDLEVPGEIADSRKVGDVIYLATHQSGWCWGCDDVASSRVTSFNVSDPSNFMPVDSAVFQTQDGWQRSISVTNQRIYISGFTWNGDDTQGGTIDVVDISDPAGQMATGANVAIAGQIESRWQIDEFDGTLRVISQPGGWGTTNPPVVETFQVNSADDIVPLASLAMVLPRPEDLRSVRFDGDRAFAITFEQTDPLFTFDLSDPAKPLQVGELEIPGWVYHMEPRGDRIYALGFDNSNNNGSLHVSLFDVSDLGNPTQIDRVNFGGDWGSFAEDQDRIHKAFNILEDEGLIMVPFSGGGYDELSCNYSYQSGIQLVDMTTDSLTKRGVAPQVGSARRALLHGGSLFGIGDNAVQAFDISDRDDPVKLDQLDTARNITNIKVMGNSVLRFGTDWWTDQTVLDFTTLDGADFAQPIGELDLSDLGPTVDGYCENGDGSYSSTYSNWGGQVFVHGNYAYVPQYVTFNSENGKAYTYTNTLVLYIVDISERTSPQIVGKLEMDPVDDQNGEFYAGIVQTDGALLVGRQKGYFYYYDASNDQREDVQFSYDVIDLTDPLEPEVVERFEVPSLMANGGWGYGVSGCSIDIGWGWWGGWGYYGGYYGGQGALVSDDIVVSQHSEPVDDGTGRVRYYLDRIDVSNPTNPAVLKKVNIPGNVVHFDAAEGRIVTIDYLREEEPADDWSDCYRNYYYGDFDEDEGVCRFYHRRLNVLELDGDVARLLDSRQIDGQRYAGSIAISEDRIFYNVTEYNEDPDNFAPPVNTVHVLSYNAAGNISEMGAVEVDNGGWWYGQLVARGGRAFMTGSNELTVIDATGSTVETARHDMAGWGCNQFEVEEDVAYCAMGQFGVKSFPLD